MSTDMRSLPVDSPLRKAFQDSLPRTLDGPVLSQEELAARQETFLDAVRASETTDQC